MKHKHADLIHAWADGAEIQCFNEDKQYWETVKGTPFWLNNCQYRIKPEEKKPVVRWLWARAKGDRAVCLFFEEEAVGDFIVKLEWSRTEFPE